MPTTAARPSLITARYAGRCSCGATFDAGTSILYKRGAVVGCPACDHGDLSGLSDDALMEHYRGTQALANLAFRTKNPKASKVIAHHDHVCDEVNRRRAAAVR